MKEKTSYSKLAIDAMHRASKIAQRKATENGLKVPIWKDGNQAWVMGKLRCFSMNLIRWSKKGTTNFQTTIEKFIDSPDTFAKIEKFTIDAMFDILDTLGFQARMSMPSLQEASISISKHEVA